MIREIYERIKHWYWQQECFDDWIYEKYHKMALWIREYGWIINTIVSVIALIIIIIHKYG